MGVVTEVKFRFEPLSKTAALTLTALPDANMANATALLQNWLGEAGNVALLWRPELAKYNSYLLLDAGNATALAALSSVSGSSSSVPPPGNLTLAAKVAQLLETAKTGPGPTFSGSLPPQALQVASGFAAAAQAANYSGVAAGALDALSCSVNLVSQAYQQLASTSHALIPLPLGIGVTNFILSNSQPPEKVIWAGEDGLAIDEIEFALEQDQFDAWVRDVQKIFAAELGGGKWRGCSALGYFLIRVRKRSDSEREQERRKREREREGRRRGLLFFFASLSKPLTQKHKKKHKKQFGAGTNDDISLTAGMRRPVLAAFALLRSRKLPDVPARYAWIQDEIELVSLCKYRARPHFGKNFARTFTNSACPIRDLYPKFDDLLAHRAILDPSHVFTPPLFDAVVAREGPVTTAPLCSLQKLCYCTRDDQCSSGWICRPGKAFPEFNVCAPKDR